MSTTSFISLSSRVRDGSLIRCAQRALADPDAGSKAGMHRHSVLEPVAAQLLQYPQSQPRPIFLVPMGVKLAHVFTYVVLTRRWLCVIITL